MTEQEKLESAQDTFVLRNQLPQAKWLEPPPKVQAVPYPQLSDLVPTNEHWARECEQQADEIGEYITNFPVTVRDKAELVELQARLRLRAIELRNAL